MSGQGSSQGVIQVHADLTRWLADEGESCEQQPQQPQHFSQWESEDDVGSGDEQPRDSLTSPDAKSDNSVVARPSHTSAASMPQPAQPRRSSLTKAAHGLAAASSAAKASKPRKQAKLTYQPATKRAASYAERYGATVLKPACEVEVIAEMASDNLSPPARDDAVSALAAGVDILVIAPFTADGVRPHFPPDACTDEAELAARYPDYFSYEATADDDDARSAANDMLPLDQATTTTTSSPPAYQPYTMSDFRTLPREVKLGRLGANVDPADVEARETKQRRMKELERQVRDENKRRMERADKQRAEAAQRVREEQSGAADTTQEGAEEKPRVEDVNDRNRRATKASGGMSGATAGVMEAVVVPVERRGLALLAKREERKRVTGAAQSDRRVSAEGPKPTGATSGKAKVKREAEKTDLLGQLLLEQEKERQKVSHIRQSLGMR